MHREGAFPATVARIARERECPEIDVFIETLSSAVREKITIMLLMATGRGCLRRRFRC